MTRKNRSIQPNQQVVAALAAAHGGGKKPAPVKLDLQDLTPAALQVMQGHAQPGMAAAAKKKKKKSTASPSSVVASLLPAAKNAARMLRLQMCPDELDQVAEGGEDFPVYPSPGHTPRYSHYSSAEGSLVLDSNNLLFTCPGQHSYGFLITDNVSDTALPFKGDVLMWNAGRADGAWLAGAAGFTSVVGAVNSAAVKQSTTLIADMSYGLLITSDANTPQSPAIVNYTSVVTDALHGCWYMVTDGAAAGAKYMYCRQPAVVNKRIVLLGDVAVAAAAGRVGTETTYPVATFYTNGGACVVNNILPSTGNALRAAYQLTGTPIQAPGDPAFFPNQAICAAIKITSGASALVNKYLMQNYTVTGGRDGPWNVTTELMQTATWVAGTSSKSFAPSLATLGQRCAGKASGILNPDLEDAEAVKTAARLLDSSRSTVYTVADLAFAGLASSLNTVSGIAYAPAQEVGADPRPVPVNFEDAGWGDGMAASVLFLTGGQAAGLTTAAVPVNMNAWCLEEAHCDATTGFSVRHPMYYADYIDWTQSCLVNVPTVARAHSFKDYVKAAWGGIKALGKDIGSKVLHTGWKVARDELGAIVLAALA